MDVVVTLFTILTAAVMVTLSQPLPGCPDRCGDVAISYPFGIGDDCSLDPKFNLSCNNPKLGPNLETSTINVTEIFIESGELRILQLVARDCYTESGERDLERSLTDVNLWFRPGMGVSQTKNKFFAVGCDTYALIAGHNFENQKLTTGCMSLCSDADSVIGESCSGAGCCEITVPTELKNQTVRLDSYSNHTSVWKFNPCSYAFTVEKSGGFEFSGESSFKALETLEKIPMIVDWSVGDVSCDEARLSSSNNNDYYCKGNYTKCIDSKIGFGYLCQCLPGYQGNPYLSDGCQDIDECKIGKYCNGTCINTPGNYSCTCDEGFTLTDGAFCIKDVHTSGPQRTLIYILSGVSVGVVSLVCVSLLLCLVFKKRKLLRQKEKFFEQNGGLMLQRRLHNSNDKEVPIDQTAKIFSEEELKKATNNYNQILGEGGYGVVYKGTLEDKRVVAIKKPKIGINTHTLEQTEQFINEVILLMQINHRNVVRLLGCCLDTEVPILVYEFITNGTLYERIHKKGSIDKTSLSWELRLKIATETACALAYLHSETNTPILHRDIKSMNILLDEKYNAKVADFGTSRLVPVDQEELSTLVQGTIGYLDPEYLQSSQLTDKSDVYSFGVVLAELVTGKRALCFDKLEGTTKNLAMSFLLLKDDEQFRRVVDEEIDYESNAETLKKVVSLAKRCLRIKGEERPTMKEVAMELEGLRTMSKHPWGKVDCLKEEENEYLLGSLSNDNTYDIDGYDLETGFTGSTSIVYDSNQDQPILRPYKDGR